MDYRRATATLSQLTQDLPAKTRQEPRASLGNGPARRFPYDNSNHEPSSPASPKDSLQREYGRLSSIEI